MLTLRLQLGALGPAPGRHLSSMTPVSAMFVRRKKLQVAWSTSNASHFYQTIADCFALYLTSLDTIVQELYEDNVVL